MKKCKLFLLPLFCLLLAGCEVASQPGEKNNEETPAEVVDPSLNITTKEMLVDETFLLSVSNVPENVVPVWSLSGDEAVSYTVYASKTSAQVRAIAAGQSTINIAVGEKTLSCSITVSVPRQRLATPVISLNDAKNGIVWTAVEGAQNYSVKVNDEAAVPQETAAYTFSLTAGTYSVQVTAKADVPEYDSVPAVYNYETKAASVGQLTFVNNKVITVGSFVGMGLEAKFADGEYAPVTDGRLTAPQDGDYTFHAKGGFDETNNFYYVEGADAVKTINIVHSLKLSIPEVELNDDQNGLIWEDDEKAVGYSIQVNDAPATTVTEPGYQFATTEGQYTVAIKALSEFDDLHSDAFEFSYEVRYTSLGELTANDGVITWASYAGKGLEVKIGNGQFTPVTGESLDISFEGTYTFHTVPGYVAGNSPIFYVENDGSINQRQVNGVPVKLIVEDASASSNALLMEPYLVEKYTSDWEPNSAAKMTLEDVENEGYTDGNCARVAYWANGCAYRYTRDIEFDRNYDTLSLNLKGDGIATSRMTIRLVITKDLVVQNYNLNGVYADYRISKPAASWNNYTISLKNDDNWKITFAGVSKTPSEIKDLLGVEFADVLTEFGSIAFIFYGSTDNYRESRMFLDDVMFLNTHAQTSTTAITPVTKLKKNYSFETASIHGQLAINDDLESGVVTSYVGGELISLPVTVALNGSTLVVTSTTSGKDFVLTLSSTTAGGVWNYVSCTGSYQFLLSNARLGALTEVENFSAYTGDGIGYDKTHGVDEVSNLRAAFYCDYYYEWNTDDTNIQSPVGGTNWWLMGSNDYLCYKSAGCLDGKSAQLRSSTGYRNMRYMSAGLATSVEEPIAKGVSKMSIWVKGATNRDVTITIYAYYRNSLAPATQQSDRSASDTLTIPQNSDWTQYTLSLNSAKVYYGFSIVVKSDNSDNPSAAYIQIDNIAMYK